MIPPEDVKYVAEVIKEATRIMVVHNGKNINFEGELREIINDALEYYVNKRFAS